MISLMDYLPLEIIELIIDNLSADESNPHNGDRNTESLRACSLTCQVFLPLSRKHIFYFIALRFDERASRFAQLIQDSPAIAHYIRDLHYEIESTHFEISLLPSAFKSLTNLRSFNLSALELKWPEVPTSLRSSLLHLIHLPTIHSLHLGPLPNIGPHELVPWPNLKDLSLFFVDDDRPFQNILPTLSTKPIQLEKLSVEGSGNKFVLDMLNTRDSEGNSILNLEALKEYTIYDIDRSGDLFEALQVLKHAQNLESMSVAGVLKSVFFHGPHLTDLPRSRRGSACGNSRLPNLSHFRKVESFASGIWTSWRPAVKNLRRSSKDSR